MAVRLPVTTIVGHVSRALSFMDIGNIYFALGKSSPWSPDESDPDFVPPLPSVNEKELQELIGMKRVSTKVLVVPDDSGTIVFRDTNWRIVSPIDAKEEGARWVMLETSVEFSDFPETAYRQIGVFTRVVTSEGVPSTKEVLLPNEISDVGILEVLDQRKVVTRNEDSKDTFSMIIEF